MFEFIHIKISLDALRYNACLFFCVPEDFTLHGIVLFQQLWKVSGVRVGSPL